MCVGILACYSTQTKLYIVEDVDRALNSDPAHRALEYFF